jgi:starch synthase
MYVIFITPELAPIAKVGGLGDVVHGLSKTLKQEGVKVEIILPYYDLIDKDKLKELKVDYENLLSYEDMEECKNTVYSAKSDGIDVFLIQPHDRHGYFSRKAIYGGEDEQDRFIYFCRAALEYLLKKGKHLDVLHINDWMTALVAPLYRDRYSSLGLKVKGILIALHNLLHQGVCYPEKLTKIGMKGEAYLRVDKMQDHKKPERLNLLKGGILYSDAVTTVSPTYSKEIKEDQGFGLESLLNEEQKKLHGILNGIDYSYWNPETDPYLKKRYLPDPSNLGPVIKAKKANRKALTKQFHMAESKAPLVTCITRIVKQKGPKLIHHGLEYALQKGGQFFLIGTIQEKDLESEFHALRDTYLDNTNVHIHLGFNEELAHLVYAAADMILIPSLFEPCGLTQMIALRYGTLPIVHKVGGLADTVFDEKNGYTFDCPSELALSRAIDRAFNHFAHEREKWEAMMQHGLSQDFSWRASASKYLELYHEIAKS